MKLHVFLPVVLDKRKIHWQLHLFAFDCNFSPDQLWVVSVRTRYFKVSYPAGRADIFSVHRHYFIITDQLQCKNMPNDISLGFAHLLQGNNVADVHFIATKLIALSFYRCKQN